MRKVININVDTNQGEQIKEVEIKRLRVFQYGAISSILGGLVTRIKNDEMLMNTIKEVFFADLDDNWADKEASELVDSAKSKVGEDLFGTVGFALEHIPNEFISLVSVLSNLPKDVINYLDEESFFKVVEAVVEVNDLERLQTLGKKSFGNLKEMLSKKTKDIQNKKDQQEHLQSVNK